MKISRNNIDIKESILRKTGNLLDILLFDHTTGKNIIWATDSYERCGEAFSPKKHIRPELVTGIYSKLIQPRAAKSLVEQRRRTKYKAEVFTPLTIVEQINNNVDQEYSPNKNNWQEYIRELRLEITCGEAPFIVSRYDPNSHTGKLIKIDSRVGFLDRKLKIVSKYCNTKKEWLYWAKEAFKASYGYEWQGDNVLLARENLLYTLIDYYEAKFKQQPTLKIQEEFAEIINWNIFQMDGLKYTIPMSCHEESKRIQTSFAIFGEKSGIVKRQTCEGCKNNKPYEHNGSYVKIMDWDKNKVVRFVDLLK